MVQWTDGAALRDDPSQINMETLTPLQSFFWLKRGTSSKIMSFIPFSQKQVVSNNWWIQVDTVHLVQAARLPLSQSFEAKAFVVALLQFNFSLYLILFSSLTCMLI